MESASGLDRKIGTRVRAIRSAGALTLDDLAAKSGVSRAMLSRIERGESSPTAQLLNRVCGGLGVTLSTLFAEAEGPPTPLRRRAEQTVWRDPESGYVRRAVSPPGIRSLAEIVEVEFPAGGSVAFENQNVAGADQQVWVLEGEMELIAGETLHRLGPGDCLYMPLDQPTAFRNPFARPARYVVVITRGGSRP